MTNVLMIKIINFLTLFNWEKTSPPFSITFIFLFVLSFETFAEITSILVTAPTHTDIWAYGQPPYNIEYIISGSGNVKIEYSINGGRDWNPIDTNVLVFNGANTYSWDIPDKPTTQALIRISDLDSSPSDTSDPYFMIKSPQTATLSGVVKILPFGDSITFGNGPSGHAGDLAGYEYRLWDSLRTNNYNFDFIGSEFSGYNYFPDFQNGGFPGIISLHLKQLLETGYNNKFSPPDKLTNEPYLNTYQANIILVHTGTNDYSTDTTYVGQMMDYIKTNYPNSWMTIAKILKSANVDSVVYKNYNTNLEAAARKRINSGYKILIVDMYNIPGFVYTTGVDLSDDVHPNASGYAKMANVWFNALKLILPAGTTEAPTFSQANIDTVGYVGIPFNYQAVASGIGTPQYSLSSSSFPDGMSSSSINTLTGKINWTPPVGSTGNYSVTITASNGIGSDANQNLIINILPTPAIPTELVSYWRFDENKASGPYTDSYNLNNGYPEKSSLSSATGQVNGAYTFDGSDKVNVLDNPDLNFSSSNNSFTAEAWINIAGGSGDRVVMGKYGRMYDASFWWLGVNSFGNATFVVSQYDGNRYTTQLNNSSIGNGWHHIVGVKNGSSSILVYVDGGIGTSASLSISAPFNTHHPLNIGHLYNGSQYTAFFNGAIDEVALYDGALDQATITDHYNRGKFYNKGYFDQFVLVKTKIFLEGPYFTTGDSMSTALKTNNYIPLTSPYSQDPRIVDSIPTGVVDWVLIELRSSAAGGDTIGYKSVFLKSDGKIVGDDGNTEQIIVDVPPASYYIVVRHRNHLAVMSSISVSLDDNSTTPTLYDFTTGDGSQFYPGNGSGAKLLETIPTNVWGMIAGDVDGSGDFGPVDLTQIRLGLINGESGYLLKDVDLTGDMGPIDLVKVREGLINGYSSSAP